MAHWYCKAGFRHVTGDKCDHIVKVQFVAAPARKPEVPVIADGYYSEEETARRRAENKLKYQPVRRRYHQDRDLVGNEVREMGDWKSS